MEEIKLSQEVQVIEKQTPVLIKKANDLKIIDERTGKLANDIMVGINKYLKTIEAGRVFIVKPFNDQIRAINNKFKAMTEPLHDALRIVKNKMLDYQVKARKRQEKQEAEKQEALKGLLGEDKAAEIPKEEPKKASVTSSLGKSFLKKVWAFEIEDISKVPDEYKLLNEKKVNLTIKANLRAVKGVSTCDLKIPGLKIYQKDQLGVR